MGNEQTKGTTENWLAFLNKHRSKRPEICEKIGHSKTSTGEVRNVKDFFVFWLEDLCAWATLFNERVDQVCSVPKSLTKGAVGTIFSTNCIEEDLILKSSPAPEDWSTTIHFVKGDQRFQKAVRLCVESQEFYNESIVGFLLNFIDAKRGSIMSVPQTVAFLCIKEGVTLGFNLQLRAETDLHGYIGKVFKFQDTRDLQTFDSRVMTFIRRLWVLKKEYNYIHGDLKAKNVFLLKKGNLVLADYGKSSMTYNGIRFICKLPFLKNLATYVISASNPIIDGLYKYEDDKIKTSVNMRHIPKLYYLSFDIYCIMASIQLHPNFEYNESLVEFNKFWRSLWLPDQFEGVTERIAGLKQTGKKLDSVNTAFAALRGFTLKEVPL